MDVLVIVLCGTVHVGLARVALRQGWPIRSLDTAVAAMREIRDRCPRVVVVQVTLLSNEPVKLIRLLRYGLQPAVVVAVASTHRTQLERVVRDAGANCYLPAADDDRSVERMVAAMLETAPSRSGSGVSAGMTASMPHSGPFFAGHGHKGVHG